MKVIRGTGTQGGRAVAVMGLRGDCSHLREQTQQTAKTACHSTPLYVPLFRCDKRRLCSPFAEIVDGDLVQECISCRHYSIS